MLVNAVIVARNRTCADVHALADFCITNVGQMIHLATVSNRALFDLDKISNLYVVGQRRTWAQSRKGSKLTVTAGSRALNMAVAMNERTRAEIAVANQVILFNLGAVTKFHFTLEYCDDVNEDIFAALARATNINARRIGETNAFRHQLVDQASL